MFTELNSILNNTPDNCKLGEFVLIMDRKADASFLVHHFLSFYLRAGCKVCFLGLVQSFSHYSAVSQRLGVSLAQAKEKGQLVFLEGLKDCLGVLLPDGPKPDCPTLDFFRPQCLDLRGLFEFVLSSLSPPGGAGGEGDTGSGCASPPVLIVDDLSVLLSLGVSVGAVLDFAHYCKANICHELKGSSVMLVRCEEEEEDEGDEEGSEMLQRGLMHQCTLALQVQGLPTGYCRDIHGQVDICWRGQGQQQQQNQKKVFQYKVQDKGASFFARGTSSAVL
ncbi:elongator complex protein 6 [Alosa sapidissima]|uniref:elongator complex protein 6 n=1 Tax=Alosa sapidissima TaxID=34773 RepID=UPI001C09CC07|nr:elongator complex protein 6 [Alosa sapidissima]XP_041964152.1 elongator complex protein 6 [Alosa sapidissima]